MPWNVSGQALELCNCAVLCGCWLGPAKPDQGWCGSTFVFDIQRGTADGVDLAGKAASSRSPRSSVPSAPIPSPQAQ